jgi:hypothetical protein
MKVTPVINFIHSFSWSLMNRPSKLECFHLVSTSSLVQYLKVMLKSACVEHHSGTHLLGRLLALPANIRPGLRVTNTLTFFASSIMPKKEI